MGVLSTREKVLFDSCVPNVMSNIRRRNKMEMTYENVGNYLAEEECCDEALVYLNKCKDEGKTLAGAYLNIPRIAWLLWLIRHLDNALARGLEIYELYEVIDQLGGFIQTFKEEYNQADKEARADGTEYGYQIESYAFDTIHDNYKLTLSRLLADYEESIFDAFKEIESV